MIVHARSHVLAHELVYVLTHELVYVLAHEVVYVLAHELLHALVHVHVRTFTSLCVIERCLSDPFTKHNTTALGTQITMVQLYISDKIHFYK